MATLKSLLTFIFSLSLSFSGETESCGKFANNSSEYCLSCSDGFYSEKESVFYDSPFSIEECLPKKNLTFEAEIFVSDQPCSLNSLCDGTFDNPYDSLTFALDSIQSNTKMYIYSIIKIFLLGKEIIILEKEAKYYFHRSMISLSISPFTCTVSNLIGCKDINDLIIIQLKTNKFFIFINGILEIINIIFDGTGLPSEIDCSSECVTKQPWNSEKISFGILNIDIFSLNINLANYAFPKITLFNCKINNLISSLSSFIKLNSDLVDLELRNIIFTNCSFWSGILVQSGTETNIIKREKIMLSYSKISFYNISITLYNQHPSPMVSGKSMVSILEFKGNITINLMSLFSIYDQDRILTVFSFFNVRGLISIKNLVFRQNEIFSFIRCSSSMALVLEDLLFINSNSSVSNNQKFIYIANLQSSSLVSVAFCKFIALKKEKDTYPLYFSSIEQNINFLNVSFEQTEYVSIKFDSSSIILRNLVLSGVILSTHFIKATNCSTYLENFVIIYVKIIDHFFIGLNAGSCINRSCNLTVLNGHFSNIRYVYEMNGGYCLFKWPNYPDKIIFKNLDIFDVSHTFFNNQKYEIYVFFFIAESVNVLELQNIDYSFYSKGMNIFIWVYDGQNVSLHNSSFRNHENIAYYIFVTFCSNCTVFFFNITVSSVSFIEEYEDIIPVFNAIFFFEGEGLVYNGNLVNFNNILVMKGKYIRDYGLVIFFKVNSCRLTNWTFKSSNNYSYFPSRFFRFKQSQLVSLENIDFQIIYTSKTNSELHLLVSIQNKIFMIRRLSAYNMNCQLTIFGDPFYENGIVSFLNSEDLIQDGEVLLTDIFISYCKFCNNGVLGFRNIKTASIYNVTSIHSESLKGGFLAIYYGIEILIRNIFINDSLAFQQGGALFLQKCKGLIVQSSFFTKVFAHQGGAFFLKHVSNFILINFKCYECMSFSDGGAIHSLNTTIILIKAFADKCKSPSDGGFLFQVNGKQIFVRDLVSVNGGAHKGGFVYAVDVIVIIIKNMSFWNHTSHSSGVILYIENCSNFGIDNVNMSDISSFSGLGTIYINMKSSLNIYSIKQFRCHNISISESNLIFLEDNTKKDLANFDVLLTDVQIMLSQGSMGVFKFINERINSTRIYLQDISVFNLRKSKTIFDPTSLFYFENAIFTLNNMTLHFVQLNMYVIRSENSFITIHGLYFLSQSQEKNTKFLFYISKSVVALTNIVFFGMSGQNTGFIYSDFSQINMEKLFIYKCHVYSASCFEFQRSKVFLENSTFFKNKGLNSGVLNLKFSLLVLKTNIFVGNSLWEANSQINFARNSANDIIILGKNDENKTSQIQDTLFLQNNSGISLFINNSFLSIFFSIYFNIRENRFTNLSLQNKAILAFSSNVEIIWSSFLYFMSEKGGTITIENCNTCINKIIFLFKLSIVIESKSDYGAVFSIFGIQNVFIFNSIFLENKARANAHTGTGGNFGFGVFLCTLCSDSKMELIDNKFINNYAENLASILFCDFRIFSISSIGNINDSNIYLNNTSGSNTDQPIFFFPIKIKFKSIEKNASAINSEFVDKPKINFKSGISFDLILKMFDGFGRPFFFNVHSIAKFSKKNFSVILSNSNSFSDNGEFYFQNFLILAKINQSFELRLEIQFLNTLLHNHHNEVIKFEPLDVIFFSKPCDIGDTIVLDDSSCHKCPEGKYSLTDPMQEFILKNNTNIKCLECPKNAFCPGGSIIIPLWGFWRYSNSSTLIVECLSKISCLGNNGLAIDDMNHEELIHGKCMDHSTGPLCHKCKLGFARYSKKGICKSCSNRWEIYGKVGIVFLLLLVYSLIQINITFHNEKNYKIRILLKLLVIYMFEVIFINKKEKKT